MDVLQNIIKSLEKEEVKSYKLFTKRTHDFEDRKDIELFESIKKNNEESDGFHNKLIYKSPKPDTKYYRLKNKITDDLGIVLTNLNHRKSEIDGLHSLSLAKIFTAKKQFSLAMHYLKLAERKSVDKEDYALLESVYEQMIRLSIQNIDVSPSEIVAKRSENMLKLNLLRELENNLSILSYEVKTTQNLSEKKEMSVWLDQTLKNTLKLAYVKNSPQLQIKIFQNLCRLMLLLKDYQSLESYLKTCLIDFESNHLFKQETHTVKLQLLVYLCNALSALKKHNESSKYADLLYKSINEYNKQNYNQYIFYYYNILVSNYFNVDLEKAIKILLEAQQEEVIKNNPTYYFYVLSNLTLSYFQSKKHKLASKLFKQMYISENYKSFDAVFKLKLYVFELANRIELEEYDVCEKELDHIQKLMLDISDEESIKQEIDFVKILSEFLGQIDKRWRPLKQTIQLFTKKYPEESNYEGGMNYTPWLNSKV